MKVEDLMLGDWVLDTEFERNEPDRIGIVEDDGRVWLKNRRCYQSVTTCEPIPITPEILEKNGFELRPDGWLWCKEEIEDQNYIFIQFRKGCDGIRNCELNYIHCVRATFKQICYVHQLQHALRLCGINKTIKL